MRLAILSVVVALAGCTSSAPQIVTRVQIEKLQIPAALLVDPQPPAPPKVNSASDVSDWVARLWADDINKTGQLAAIGKLQTASAPQTSKP